MVKLFLAFLTSISMMFSLPLCEKSNTQISPKYQIAMRADEGEVIENPGDETPFEEKLFTYIEDGITFNIKLTSETEYTLEMVEGEITTSIKGTYILAENVLTLNANGKQLYKFTVNEDNTLTKYTDSTTYTEEDLKKLFEELVAELGKDETDWTKVKQILIGIAGASAFLIISLLFYLIKLKMKTILNQDAYNKLVAKFDEKLDEIRDEARKNSDALRADIYKRFDDSESARKAEAEAQSIKLKQSIEVAKANLQMDDVLDKKY